MPRRSKVELYEQIRRAQARDELSIVSRGSLDHRGTAAPAGREARLRRSATCCPVAK
jgi:hypothetical protein